jgi:hypothetical protein
MYEYHYICHNPDLTIVSAVVTVAFRIPSVSVLYYDEDDTHDMMTSGLARVGPVKTIIIAPETPVFLMLT